MPLKLVRNPAKSPYWYIRGTTAIWRDGRPETVTVHGISTRTADKKEALGILEQYAQGVKQRNINNTEPEKSFKEAVADYIRAGGDTRFLIKPVERLGDFGLSQLTQTRIDMEGRAAYPNATTSTIRRQWHGPIATVLKHTNPDRRVKRPPGGAPRTDWFRPDQAEMLIEQCAAGRYENPWAGPLVTLLFGAGPRLSEALTLDARDVDLAYAFARFRDTKNGKDRIAYLCPRVVAALSTLPNIGMAGPLFRAPSGRPYSVKDNTGTRLKFFATAVERIGLDPHRYTPHICRHSWATWFYAITRDPLRLKIEGNWSSLALVERYAKVYPGLDTDVLAHNWSLSGESPSEGIRPRASTI